MKNIYTITVILLAILSGYQAFAQNPWQGPRNNDDWASRMKSEKIGFLTSEIGLTPQEAQAFWPIYNRAEDERAAAMLQVRNSFGDMMNALNEGKGDFTKLLDNYLIANSAQVQIDQKYAKEYLKVLSAEKVAKLFAAEEKFRREQINKLNPYRNNFGIRQPGK